MRMHWLKVATQLCLLLFLQTAGANFCRDIFVPNLRAGMPQLSTPPAFPVGYSVESFPLSSAGRAYAQLALRSRLLFQSARELEDLGLLRENGGLCASSCLTNVVASMAAQGGNFNRLMDFSPMVTEFLVQRYTEVYNKDARMGADVSLMANVMVSYLPEILNRFQFDNTQMDINITLTKMHSEFYPYRLFSLLKGDSIAIATVQPVEGRASAHAIVILKVDLEGKKLLISDPNRPNQILAVPFRYTQGTDVVFPIPFTYPGQMVQFIQINAFQRSFHPQH